MMISKLWEACCDFGKGVLCGGSLERSQGSVPYTGPWFPLQLSLDVGFLIQVPIFFQIVVPGG